MARYNVCSLSRRTIWVDAIHYGLEQLARTNPGWSYSIESLVRESETVPHLSLLDLTTQQSVCVESFPVSGPRMLILVHASQRRMIKQLFEQTRCSILCVDEHAFNFREIIESSMRNKRFLSPFIREVTAEDAPCEDKIILTEAENKVLSFIREGKSGVEISQALFRSQKTVSSHKRNIMRKFGVRDDLGLKKKLLAMSESKYG
ncbi:helix-turn-helix transcriptional regulator [Scandinavium lactucae]|uniref:LuxR C-terminal-related transcriptional regulator n=1 Tax=Scandinavium lactucae TaxID=3095028 RepID=A0ABU4QQL9_9ENTR|nr:MULTISPECIES: LuxR C-terminal-related transcriptional regulator [unclassified Scandinavium]MDX6041533.1 LuxR C-terminal-related transcriptional regulator [Scandinavium sp. V105_6]MDX6052014.1 LuxR C-terminal-related transcriptional regulator [Scandinavium sp. V105_1]